MLISYPGPERRAGSSLFTQQVETAQHAKGRAPGTSERPQELTLKRTDPVKPALCVAGEEEETAERFNCPGHPPGQ